MLKTLVLDTTGKTITAKLAGAVTTSQPVWTSHWGDDVDSNSGFVEGSANGLMNSTTLVTLVAAPASGDIRMVKELTIMNVDTAAATVLLYLSDGGTDRQIARAVLGVNEYLTTDGTFDANGALKTVIGTVPASLITGLLALANGGTHADLSGTGGAGQFLRQSTVGGNISVSAIASSDLDAAMATPPNIGTLTQAVGWFSDLRTYSGLTVYGKFAHNNLANRTWLFPDYNATMATLAGAEVFTNKTHTSPIINTGVSGSAIDNDPTLAANSSTLLATQQAVKGYVDAVAQGLSPKNACKLATTAALAANTYNNGSSGVGATLTGNSTGVLTVDGVAVALNDRILVKDEATGSRNGIYKCTTAGAVGVAYVLTRASDFDLAVEIPGAYTFVEAGTVNTGAGFVCTNASPPTIGTTAITFTQFSGAGQITAGTGLTKSGNTISMLSPSSVPISGASGIDGTPVGQTTPAAGKFSTLDQSAGTLIVPTSGTPPATTGQAVWNTTSKYAQIYDGVQVRDIGSAGWVPYARQIGASASQAWASAAAMAAVSGTYLIPIHVVGHMNLYSVSVFNKDTTLQRSWTWALYCDRLNNSSSIAQVAVASGTDTFTASAISTRTLTASAVTYIPPGFYWLALQNVHATQTFAVAADTVAASWTPNNMRFKTLGATLGSTLDIVTSWTNITSIFAAQLNGNIAGQSTPIF